MSRLLDSYPTKDEAERFQLIYAKYLRKHELTDTYGVIVRPLKDVWGLYVETYEESK